MQGESTAPPAQTWSWQLEPREQAIKRRVTVCDVNHLGEPETKAAVSVIAAALEQPQWGDNGNTHCRDLLG